jgi:hypothetical protein
MGADSVSFAEDATDLAELFGGGTGDDVDKFAGRDWRRGHDP